MHKQTPSEQTGVHQIFVVRNQANISDLQIATKRLHRYLAICGISGLIIIIGFGVCIAKFIAYCQTPDAMAMGASIMLLPIIGFDFVVAVPLGVAVSVLAINQMRKYKGKFGKIRCNKWYIFGIFGLVVCLTPAVITVLFIAYMEYR